MTDPTPRDDEMVLRIVEITPTHPQGFGGHEFEYESSNDLFKCCRCGAYEVVVRDSKTGAISECPGPACPDCGVPVDTDPTRRDERHDHCGPLPHTGPIGGPYCERCE